MKPESFSPRGTRHNMRGEAIIDGQRDRTAYNQNVLAVSLLTGNSLPKRSRMPYTILLVDDDDTFREEFASAFDDYRIVEARSGAEALGILREPHEIDLVILDVMLPGQRGTDVLREIKRMEPDLGVIMLTGYGSKEIAIAALKGNADDFLEKPVDIEKARGVVERLVLARCNDERAGIDDIPGKIERVKAFVKKNYHKKVGLEDAAAIVCMSPKYLSRIFGERAGIGFNEFRLGAKIEKAKELLGTTELTISEISYRIGYRNVESFVRIFKKHEGSTPTEYRDAARGAKAGKKRARPSVGGRFAGGARRRGR
jgi:YesN/AraC family two-component response regulator